MTLFNPRQYHAAAVPQWSKPQRDYGRIEKLPGAFRHLAPWCESKRHDQMGVPMDFTEFRTNRDGVRVAAYQCPCCGRIETWTLYPTDARYAVQLSPVPGARLPLYK